MLEQRIQLAEQRLIAREERLRLRWHSIVARTQRATEPRRWVLPMLGAGLALLTGWRHARSERRSASHRPPGRRPISPVRRAPPWLRKAFFMLWPMLPSTWRARWGPDARSMLAAAAMPLFELLIRPRAYLPLGTVESVDLARFVGSWYELASLPQAADGACLGPRSFSYALRGDAMDVTQRCRGAGDGQDPRVQHGLACQSDGGAPGARWKLSWLPAWLRGLPFAWADSWIVYLDADYAVAMLGNPARDHLCILARKAEIPGEQLQALVTLAREAGFPVERLRYFGPG
ncbi:lipocalin family protein [Paucibacter soli]|uniref:lipocalin family protein n=1 Tax=Paucibacter soli TaxID=3133433 RepID=UPI0030B6C033